MVIDRRRTCSVPLLVCGFVRQLQGGQSREQIYFFLIMSATPVKEVAEFEWCLLASLYCVEHSLGGINLYLELLCIP